MDLNFHIPTSPLRNYIRSVTCYEGYTGSSTFEMLLPDGNPQLIITLEDEPRFIVNTPEKQTNLSYSWLTGFFSKPLTYKSEINASTLSIQFKPYGLSCLLGVSAAAFTNQIVETDLVLGSSISELREKLIDANSFQSRVEIIETFFLKKLVNINAREALVASIVNRETFDDDTLRLWSKHYSYSQKHILSEFNRLTGTTPKKLQTIRRINKALSLLNQNISFAQIAYACGFYDQAHFIKKFKEVTSMTPGKYTKINRSYPHVINLD